MSEVFPRLMCQGLKDISVLVFTPLCAGITPNQTSESDFITHRPNFDADSESGIYSMCYHITFFEIFRYSAYLGHVAHRRKSAQQGSVSGHHGVTAHAFKTIPTVLRTIEAPLHTT